MANVQVRTILNSTINPRLFHQPLLLRRLLLINLPRMPRRIVIRVPLGSQITPPRRRALVAAFLLDFPIRGGAVGAVLGCFPGRHLWVSGRVVEGSTAVVARTRRHAAHFWKNFLTEILCVGRGSIQRQCGGERRKERRKRRGERTARKNGGGVQSSVAMTKQKKVIYPRLFHTCFIKYLALSLSFVHSPPDLSHSR